MEKNTHAEYKKPEHCAAGNSASIVFLRSEGFRRDHRTENDQQIRLRRPSLCLIHPEDEKGSQERNRQSRQGNQENRQFREKPSEQPAQKKRPERTNGKNYEQAERIFDPKDGRFNTLQIHAKNAGTGIPSPAEERRRSGETSDIPPFPDKTARKGISSTVRMTKTSPESGEAREAASSEETSRAESAPR